MAFTDDMRAAASGTWEKALDHRFFREVAADTVADDVFRRYPELDAA